MITIPARQSTTRPGVLSSAELPDQGSVLNGSVV
jgi:hypothetical protein